MIDPNRTDACILIVDDEEANVDLLEQMLARAGYTNLRSTTDPRQVLTLFDAHQPDLILLDLLMPHLDGFAVMERVRHETPADAYLPILVLTAMTTPEIKRRALDSGATDFLTKPFDHVELLLRVRNLLRTRSLYVRLHDQIERLERLYADAEQTVAHRAQQLATVTHDLGQPLTTLRVAAQALQRRQTMMADAAQETPLADPWSWFEVTISQMMGMIGELLDMSRIEDGRALDLDLRSAELVSLVREEVAAQQLRSERHAIRIEAEPSELIGEWDAARITRVIANLLSNAVKYSPAGGPITVTVASEGIDWAVVRVRDEGVGIPAADLPHIFERYQRGANVAGRIAGTGIGLAGARQIVELHGGTIAVESVEGQGSDFTVRLPRA